MYEVNNIKNPVLRAIEKFKKHPSIKAIASTSKNDNLILEKVSYKEILHEIKQLNTRKAWQDTDVPSKIVKMKATFADFLHQNLNDAIATSVFPRNLKDTNITPVLKKGDRNSEINDSSVSIHPNLSKIYERCLYKQMSKCFDKILSKYQCGFRKDFNSQHWPATMLEKWQKTIDKDCFGALLTDLSKSFDCILHDLLTSKLHAYGVGMKSLWLLYSYLNGRKQSAKINDKYSSFEEILFRVPQASILGPSLFNIFISDLFLILIDIGIASYTDNTLIVLIDIEIVSYADNTPYCSYWHRNRELHWKHPLLFLQKNLIYDCMFRKDSGWSFYVV